MGSFSPCGQISIRRCFVLPSTRNAGKVVTMSGGLDVLQMKEEDVLKFLAAGTHLGGTNMDFQMEHYVYKRKSDGVYIINLKLLTSTFPPSPCATQTPRSDMWTSPFLATTR